MAPRILFMALLAVLPTAGQENAGARDARWRLEDLTAQAIACFHSADAVEDSLRADEHVLHPRLVAMRLRVQSSLDAARASLERGDPGEAAAELKRAAALIQQLTRAIGA